MSKIKNGQDNLICLSFMMVNVQLHVISFLKRHWKSSACLFKWSDIPTFYIVNVGGGYLDGDRYKFDIRVQENASVTLTSQGATKIYKTLKDHVEQYQNFHIEDNAYLEYVGDPIIAYKDAKFYQRNQFHLAKTGAMFYTDILTPGYSPDERHFTYDYLHLLNEIYVNDELVVFDNMLLDPNKIKLTP